MAKASSITTAAEVKTDVSVEAVKIPAPADTAKTDADPATQADASASPATADAPAQPDQQDAPAQGDAQAAAPAGVTLATPALPDTAATSETAATAEGAAENVLPPAEPEPAPVPGILQEIEGIEHRSIPEMFGNVGAVIGDIESINRSCGAHIRAAVEAGDNELAGLLERVQSVIGDFRQGLRNVEQAASVRIRDALSRVV